MGNMGIFFIMGNAGIFHQPYPEAENCERCTFSIIGQGFVAMCRCWIFWKPPRSSAMASIKTGAGLSLQGFRAFRGFRILFPFLFFQISFRALGFKGARVWVKGQMKSRMFEFGVWG